MPKRCAFIRAGFTLVMFLITMSATGQDSNRSQRSENANVLLNNSVLTKGMAEVILFNVLTVQDLTTVRENDAILEKSDRRGITHFLQFNYGVSDKLRLNAGVDILYTYNRVNTETYDAGDLSTVTTSTVNGIQSIGPRIRWLPFARLPELSIQSALAIPVASDLEKRQQLGSDRLTWLNYVIFYQRFFGFIWQVQGGFGTQFKNEDRNQTTYLISALSLLAHPILEDKLFALATIEYSASHEESITGGWRRLDKTWVLGAGLFWQLDSKHWSLNASIQFPFSYELASLITTIDKGSWRTLNLGIRYGL